MTKNKNSSPKSTNEVGAIKIDSVLRITDPQTGKIILETRG